METNFADVTKICYGCLCSDEESRLFNFNIENGPLQCIFQVNTINLCYLCKRSAEKVSRFVQNVQNNQLLLENLNNIIDPSFHTVRSQIRPLVNLKQVTLESIDVFENGDVDEMLTGFNSGRKELKVKIELKQENDDEDTTEQINEEFPNDDNVFSGQCLKEEVAYPLRDLLKSDVQVEIDVMTLEQAEKQNKPKKKEGPSIEKILLTKQQCIDEREKQKLDKKYQEFTYKCMDCVIGFENKRGYDTHMEKHSENAGTFVCDICNTRKESSFKLTTHRKFHFIRYKCTECGLVRNHKNTIKDHYSALHAQGNQQYNCPHCPKDFKREVSLKKHIWYAHKSGGSVICAYCHKTYAHKEVLKIHMMARHAKEVSAVEKPKKWICQVCGVGFRCSSHLKSHSRKHVNSKDYYCVECDKSFKSDTSLKQHLRNTQAHVNYKQLPLPCQHCNKRFPIRRDLERHINSIHLNVKPFQCDLCDKAYVSSWSLIEHKRLVHEGYKRPMKYPCTMCDKIFTRGHVLKAHLRTHTGERPYQCSECPAHFNQASNLTTHVKLVHLKQPSDGK